MEEGEPMIKVNELFAGIGAFRKALVNLQIPHEVVGISEIDKYAILSYEAIYGKTNNYGDISKVNKLDYADLWTYGFPCQDISIAGQLKGLVKNETRSGLLYEVGRLLLESQKHNELPKYLIMENVKNLVGKRFIEDFNKWLNFLETLGYKNYWKVLNAKDYGVPQNRERVFCVSLKRKITFNFPDTMLLDRKLKDVLESKVNQRYYLSDVMINYCLGVNQKESNFPRKERFIANITRKNSQIANTISTSEGNRPVSNFVLDKECDTTLESLSGHIRKLTPKECWRLMGFNDEDFNKANKVCSNTQLYKQAGNSIVVPVLEKILQNLLLSRPWEIENKSCSKWLDDLLVIPHADYTNEINYL